MPRHRRKQKLACEHIGYGRYCHRCQAAAALLALLQLSNAKRSRLQNKQLSKMSDEDLKKKVKYFLDEGKASKWRVSTSNKFISADLVPKITHKFKRIRKNKEK